MTDKNKNKEGRCNCRVCEYGQKIDSLASRQPNLEDSKMIRDLYEHMALLEDDNGMYNGRWTATKDVLCLVRKEHFEAKGYNWRLAGHEKCRICELLEQL